MGLQEVRWQDAGETTIAGHTILWSGPPIGEPRQGGVALVLGNKAAASLVNWQPISNRLLSARLAHSLVGLSITVHGVCTDQG